MQCNFEPLVGFEMTYLDFFGAMIICRTRLGGIFRFGPCVCTTSGFVNCACGFVNCACGFMNCVCGFGL